MIMEPIVGYRGWLFDRENQKLRSMFVDTYWEPGKLLSSDTPKIKSSSEGIHAFKGLNLFEDEYGQSFPYTCSKLYGKLFPLIRGEVYLWGKIVEHYDGYRAEFAYPKKLYVPNSIKNCEEIAQSLRQKYNCEVIIDKYILRNIDDKEKFIIHGVECFAQKYDLYGINEFMIYCSNPLFKICRILNSNNKYDALRAFQFCKEFKNTLKEFTELYNFSVWQIFKSNILLNLKDFIYRFLPNKQN